MQRTIVLQAILKGSLARLILAFSLLMGTSVGAFAETRLALIIANYAYPGGQVRPLTNPPNDADEMGRALRETGFTVVVERNLGKAEMENAVVAFAGRLRAAGPDSVGFFYYSGHGASVEINNLRQNYLLPARTSIAGAQDLPLRGVPLQPLLDTLSATRVKGVFFVSDACRNTLDIGSDKGGSDADRSFVAVPRRAGLFVAFATQDGAVAPDDGHYARQLATYLRTPGLTPETVFARTNRAVAQQRGANRLPEVRDAFTSAMDGFVFQTSGPRLLLPETTERAAWDQIARSRSASDFQRFLQRFPNGEFTEAAAVRVQAFSPPGALPAFEGGPPARSFLVFFDYERSDLRVSDPMFLRRIAVNALSLGSTGIDVRGNADMAEGAVSDRGQALSEERARRVASVLMSRFAMPRELFTIIANGSARPIVRTAAGTREEQNRYVEVNLR
jgi:outer membrane protein OmpA-like peptidoglycan-associated protein